MFGRHRTYHLREPWIAKGLSALRHAETQGRTDNVFLRPDAVEQFGMGPGMVQAVRFWLLACGLIVEQSSGSRLPQLTALGRLLSCYDPYLERLDTLWLLHSQLVRNRLLTPTWFWFFNAYAHSRLFDQRMCLEALHSWVIAGFPDRRVERSSLQKDLRCLLRMYESTRPITSPQEGTASPFARLGMLSCTQAERTRQYRLVPPDPERLHPLILLSVLTYQQRLRRVATSLVSWTEVFYEPGNIGRVFPLLTRNQLLDVLMQLEAVAREWSVGLIREGGQEYLCLPSCSPEQILRRYYQKETSL